MLGVGQGFKPLRPSVRVMGPTFMCFVCAATHTIMDVRFTTDVLLMDVRFTTDEL